MKIRMGLFNDGTLIEVIGGTLEATKVNVMTMNAVAGWADKHLQDIKERDEISDKTYISFDYVK